MPATVLILSASLAAIRKHLNLADEEASNDLLLAYVESAERWIDGYLGTDIHVSPPDPRRRQAVLMLVAHWFGCREGVSPERLATIPFGIYDLLSGLKARVTGYVPEGQQ